MSNRVDHNAPDEVIEALIPSSTDASNNTITAYTSNRQKSSSAASVKVFGFSIPLFIASNPITLFISLSICAISCSLIFAFLQEKVTSIEGFVYPKFMTIIQTFTFTLCAWLEMMCSFGLQGTIFIFFIFFLYLIVNA